MTSLEWRSQCHFTNLYTKHLVTARLLRDLVGNQ